MRYKSVLLCLLFGWATVVVGIMNMSAQTFALKTNLASDAFANITLAGEEALSQKWSIETSGSFNGWVMPDQRRWKHWELMEEGRYWLCDIYGGSFIAAHVFGGQYNVGGLDINANRLGTDYTKLKDHRFQGWYAGAGVGYGYALPLTRHLNLEAEAAFGCAYTRYDMFRCATCGKKLLENQPHNYVGPTKATLSLVYVF